MDQGKPEHQPTRHARRTKWIFVAYIAVAVFFLWTEHRAHLLGALPYLILLACPLMHIFHHRHRHRDPAGTSHEHR